MNPLTAFLISEIVRQTPALAIELVQLLSRPAPTDQDWEQLKARYSGRSYDAYLREAQPANPGQAS